MLPTASCTLSCRALNHAGDFSMQKYVLNKVQRIQRGLVARYQARSLTDWAALLLYLSLFTFHKKYLFPQWTGHVPIGAGSPHVGSWLVCTGDYRLADPFGTNGQMAARDLTPTGLSGPAIWPGGGGGSLAWLKVLMV